MVGKGDYLICLARDSVKAVTANALSAVMDMRRRDFIRAFAALAAVWPLAPRAETQPTKARRIGALMGLAETDPFTIKYVRVLRAALEKLGWRNGENVQFTYRYAADYPGRARAYAKELVDIHPDLIVGHTTPVAVALSQSNRTIPVVFVLSTDPVRDGFVSSMAHPGGNMTGFTSYDVSMGAPRPTRGRSRRLLGRKD